MRHKPFGEGSGQRICDEYGVPNLFQMPIVPELSACGDSGKPLVLADPRGRFRRSTASDRRESRAGGGEAAFYTLVPTRPRRVVNADP